MTAGGMIQNTGVAQQMILPQQQQQQQPRAINLCQVNQPINLGQVASPQLQFGQPVNLGPVNPTLSFGQAGQPLAVGQVNHTLNLSQVNQVIGSPGQIRFTAMPNFGFNAAGQLVGGAQTLLNFQVVQSLSVSLPFCIVICNTVSLIQCLSALNTVPRCVISGRPELAMSRSGSSWLLLGEFMAPRFTKNFKNNLGEI